MTNGNFNLREKPLVAPGRCLVCDNYSSPCVDFGKDIVGIGVIYLCINCIKDAHEILPEDELIEDFASEELLAIENEELLAENTRNREELDGLANSLIGWLSARGYAVGPIPIPTEETGISSTNSPVGTEQQIDGASRQKSKSASVKESVGVSSNSLDVEFPEL